MEEAMSNIISEYVRLRQSYTIHPTRVNQWAYDVDKVEAMIIAEGDAKTVDILFTGRQLPIRLKFHSPEFAEQFVQSYFKAKFRPRDV